MMANKRKVLSVTDKVAIIKEAENGAKNIAICKKYGLSSSTVSTLLKNREPLLRAFERNITTSKRLKKCEKADLDEVLYKWYIFQKNAGLPTNGPVMRSHAETFAFQLGYENFSCTNGWLHRFRMRHNIFSSKKNGEAVPDSPLENSTCLDVLLSSPTNELNKSEESGIETSNTHVKMETMALPASYASSEIVYNFDSFDATDHKDNSFLEKNGEASRESTKEMSKCLDLVRPSQTLNVASQEIRIESVSCRNEIEKLPQPSCAEATDCVETLQCFFESRAEMDSELFTALSFIRRKLWNIKQINKNKANNQR